MVFFDGAEHRDSTCAVGCTIPQTEDEKPHLFRIFAHEKPERAGDWTVDRDAVDADIRRLFERWEVFKLAADPHGWQTDIGQWSDEYGSCVTIFDTRLAVFGVALDDFYAAVVNDDVTNDGDPRLRRTWRTRSTRRPGAARGSTRITPTRRGRSTWGFCAAGALSRARFHAGANSRECVLDTREFCAEHAGPARETTVVSSGLPEAKRLRVLDLVLVEEEGSPFVGLLRVELAG